MNMINHSMENYSRNIRLEKLMEREKELNCLYAVESLLHDDGRKIEYILQDLAAAIPRGWQYTTVCECRITLEGKEYSSPDFRETEYMQSADIIIDDHVAGRVDVAYLQLIRLHKGSAFLSEEQKLLNIIATNIGRSIFRRQLKSTLEYIKESRERDTQTVDDSMIIAADSDEHWKWRYEIIERLAAHLDLERFGLKGLYLIGSTKNANAGPGSDIDLLALSKGDQNLNRDFKQWIEGWGLCLDELNYRKTGFRSNESLIDLHIVTDDDIKQGNSYAIMINAVSDRARPIKIIE
jgi:predicted nucleotidyltransferase